MGRGRAKAKQTKIAREIKYSTVPTDLDRLRKELSGGAAAPASSSSEEEFADDEWEDPDAEEDDE